MTQSPDQPIIVKGPLSKNHEDDAGWDIISHDQVVIPPQTTVMIPGGLPEDDDKYLETNIPSGIVGLVCPRSGLAAKHNISVLNAPGIIDSGYDGVIHVILRNFDTEKEFIVEPGMRIAQLLFVELSARPVVGDHIVVGKEIRGTGGFGSTGI